MTTSDIREKLIAKINDMPDEQVEALLHYAEAMKPMPLSENYSPEDDPVVGFITAEVGFKAADSKKILRSEITPRSGWTQKDS